MEPKPLEETSGTSKLPVEWKKMVLIQTSSPNIPVCLMQKSNAWI